MSKFAPSAHLTASIWNWKVMYRYIVDQVQSGAWKSESLWWGMWTNAGVPDEIADKLAGDIAGALSAPDVSEKLKKRGFEAMKMGRGDFAQFVQEQIESIAQTVKEAGIQPK